VEQSQQDGNTCSCPGDPSVDQAVCLLVVYVAPLAQADDLIENLCP